jgi:hypothetical protein
MCGKEIMAAYLRSLNNKNKLIKLLKIFFGYKDIKKDNYLVRLYEDDDRVVMDIYDNINDNRFNRYIFDFKNTLGIIVREYRTNVYITEIYIRTINKTNKLILKFAYIFKLKDEEMNGYAKNILPKELLTPLLDIIKKPI